MAAASRSPPSQPGRDRLERRQEQIKRRVRTRQACKPCQRRRRKCNGRFPCAQCIGYSYRCEYAGGPPEEVDDQIPSLDNETTEDVKLGADAVIEAVPPSQQPDALPPGTENGIENLTPDVQGPGTPRGKPRPTVDPVKGRFANAHSSILLPRKLGQTMDLAKHIRFHSYGWYVYSVPTPRA